MKKILKASLLLCFGAVSTLCLGKQEPHKQTTTSCYNPLAMNDKPFNFAAFSIISKGIVAVVTGNPETESAEKVPFRMYLLRNGHVVQQGASDTTWSVLGIEVSSVLALARFGDELVTEPTRKCDASAKRIFKLKPLFNSDLLTFFRIGKNGC